MIYWCLIFYGTLAGATANAHVFADTLHPNVQKWLDFEYAPQKSQEWLDLRMGMLTASDAASAIGVNKYETPATVEFTKFQLRQYGIPYDVLVRIYLYTNVQCFCLRI